MEKRPTQSSSGSSVTSDSGIDVSSKVSLLEEITREVALKSPQLKHKLITRPIEEPPAPPHSAVEEKQQCESFGYDRTSPHGSFDLRLSNSPSPSDIAATSEPPRSPPHASTLFGSSSTVDSSHLGYLLISNARRKLELEEERLEFEKEKQREKDKRKSKKLFFRLSKRVREKPTCGTDMIQIPPSLSEGALRRIDEDDDLGNSAFVHRNASTDSGLTPSAEDRDESVEEKVKRLERELKEAIRYGTESDAKCLQLRKMQKTLDNEVQDLTETLFQEAYKMANAAEARRETAEKLLNEALLKVDLLQAEVKALKEIVKSPSKRTLRERFSSSSSQKRSESSSVSKLSYNCHSAKSSRAEPIRMDESLFEEREHDPIYYNEFVQWRQAPPHTVPESLPFWQRVLHEDVEPCLTFGNKELAARVHEAIQKNTLEMEPHFDTTPGIKCCALLQIEKKCPYRLRTDFDSEWVFISLFARNRITAVCDFFTYLRYLRNGIVKAELDDAFLEVTAMRKNMALARFGFDFVAKMTGTGLTHFD